MLTDSQFSEELFAYPAASLAVLLINFQTMNGENAWMFGKYAVMLSSCGIY